MKEMHTYKIDSKVSVVELAMDEKKAGTTAGYRHTQQTIDKIAKANTGKVHDDASRAKMRGRVVGEETRAKLAAARARLRAGQARRRAEENKKKEEK